MTRIFLAFLALLGLVAQAAPAQARLCQGTEVGVVQNAGAVVSARAVRSSRTIRVLPTPAFAVPAAASPVLAFDHAAFVATTLIGIDRAAE